MYYFPDQISKKQLTYKYGKYTILFQLKSSTIRRLLPIIQSQNKTKENPYTHTQKKPFLEIQHYLIRTCQSTLEK